MWFARVVAPYDVTFENVVPSVSSVTMRRLRSARSTMTEASKGRPCESKVVLSTRSAAVLAVIPSARASRRAPVRGPPARATWAPARSLISTWWNPSPGVLLRTPGEGFHLHGLCLRYRASSGKVHRASALSVRACASAAMRRWPSGESPRPGCAARAC